MPPKTIRGEYIETVQKPTPRAIIKPTLTLNPTNRKPATKSRAKPKSTARKTSS